MAFAWQKEADRLPSFRTPDEAAARRLAVRLINTPAGDFFKAALPIIERACRQSDYRRSLFALVHNLQPVMRTHRVLTNPEVRFNVLAYVQHFIAGTPDVAKLQRDFEECLRVDGRRPSPMADAIARSNDPSSWPDVEGLSARKRHLLALCRKLADASADGVFFLSCRDAAAVCGWDSPRRAAAALRELVALGRLAVVETWAADPVRRARLARSYRFPG